MVVKVYRISIFSFFSNLRSFLSRRKVLSTFPKKDGLGGGDIKLTGAVGLLLGWERLLLAMVLASVSACVILMILQRKQGNDEGEEDSDKEYPFAPFLCSGFWVALTFGAQIITWYLSLFGI